MSKTLTAVLAASALAIIPAAAMANNGDPQNCEANPQQPFCTGTTGPQGEPGVDGTDGANGTDGVDGTNGTDGAAGTIGATGAAGVTTTVYVQVPAAPVHHRIAKCERRFDRSGKLVVVCVKTTCPRRQSKTNPRHVVIVCRKARKG